MRSGRSSMRPTSSWKHPAPGRSSSSGSVAEEVLARADEAAAGPRVWLSITGYGRTAPGRDRVAFGDDAAAAGGMVAWDQAGPCFLADAVADPCAGLVGAAAVLRALASGGRWLIDVSMRDVAAHLAGPTSGAVVDAAAGGPAVAPPRARPVTGRGPGSRRAHRRAPGRAPILVLTARPP